MEEGGGKSHKKNQEQKGDESVTKGKQKKGNRG